MHSTCRNGYLCLPGVEAEVRLVPEWPKVLAIFLPAYLSTVYDTAVLRTRYIFACATATHT